MGTHHGASALDASAARALPLSANDAGDWVQAHEALSRLSRQRAALDAEEGRWLLCAWRSAAHVHLGYGSFAQYVASLFGYKPRTTQEKLRVAEALEALPRVAGALEAGALSWCAARELSRVARPDNELAWLDTARGKTLRELEALVASTASRDAPGDAPDAPPSERPRPRVLRFEVEPDTFATFREAVQHLQRAAGARLDDDALLLALARHVLGGPGDDGRSSYQISLDVCAACGHGAQVAAGERVPVDAAVVDMATCDAQHLGELLPRGAAPRVANENALTIARVEGRAGAADSSGDERSPTSILIPQRPDHAHVGAVQGRAGAADSSDDELTPTPRVQNQRSDHAHVGADDRPLPRAKQSIPPALRRAVLMRDQRRCRAPGCTHATFVDVHHVRPRAEGGRNEASNLLTLCGAHHRAVHRGELLIEREHDGALIFRHADGSAYGHPVAPRLIDAHAKIFCSGPPAPMAFTAGAPS